MGKFVITRTDSGFRFVLKAANGETIAGSEVYSARGACVKGIHSLIASASKAKLQDLTRTGEKPLTNPKFEIYTDKSGEYRFRLRSRNGKIVAVSDGYTTYASCLNGIQSVCKNAVQAQIEDLK